jgi:subtilisin family serine protease
MSQQRSTCNRIRVGLLAAIGGWLPAVASGVEIEGLTRTDAVPDRYIVELRNEAIATDLASEVAVYRVAQQIVTEHRGKIGHVFGHVLRGFSVALDLESAQRLAKDPRVARISTVVEGRANQAATAIPPQPHAPWGLDRIDQAALPLNGWYAPGAADGRGVNLYILDSGVNDQHPDVAGRVATRIGFAVRRTGSGDSDPPDGGNPSLPHSVPVDDDDGHGTHVAAIAAGSVYGVAKQATLHSIKVLIDGRGWSEDIVKAADWLMANAVRPAVINMSLGFSPNATVDGAVQSLVQSGFTVVVAAGNDAADACLQSPARVPGAITVGSSRRSDDRRSLFSNHGPCVDLFAPGEDIPSADSADFSKPRLKTGTSMAAPHVAGAAALFIAATGVSDPGIVADQLAANVGANRVVSIRFISPVMQAPASVFTSHLGCWGYNLVMWPAVSDATHYELWVAPTAAFASPSFVLSTSHTSTDDPYFALPEKYVKVRACNAALGCGEFNRYPAVTRYHATCGD